MQRKYDKFWRNQTNSDEIRIWQSKLCIMIWLRRMQANITKTDKFLPPPPKLENIRIVTKKFEDDEKNQNYAGIRIHPAHPAKICGFCPPSIFWKKPSKIRCLICLRSLIHYKCQFGVYRHIGFHSCRLGPLFNTPLRGLSHLIIWDNFQ